MVIRVRTIILVIRVDFFLELHFFLLYLHCQTNNLYIMRKLEQSVNDKLLLDVMEYAFVEWLVQRGIFAAFRTNYYRTPLSRKTFRECLRDHIQHAYRTPSLGPEALISSAFLFPSTPEGPEFWMKQSDSWSRFYNRL